jgi:hypothetical protein
LISEKQTRDGLLDSMIHSHSQAKQQKQTTQNTHTSTIMLRSKPICSSSKISTKISGCSRIVGWPIECITTPDEHANRVQAIRTKVTLILDDRLRSLNKAPHDEIISQLAKRLEQLLFQSATSFESYCELPTLEPRLRIVLTVQLQRRLSKSSKLNRGRILRKILGKAKFNRVQDLVRDIRLQKNKKVATMKCSGGTCSLPFRQRLPQPVRDLFFNTSLLDAFERSPLENSPILEWDALIAAAEDNLQAYHEWANENY